METVQLTYWTVIYYQKRPPIIGESEKTSSMNVFVNYRLLSPFIGWKITLNHLLRQYLFFSWKSRIRSASRIRIESNQTDAKNIVLHRSWRFLAIFSQSSPSDNKARRLPRSETTQTNVREHMLPAFLCNFLH